MTSLGCGEGDGSHCWQDCLDWGLTGTCCEGMVFRSAGLMLSSGGILLVGLLELAVPCGHTAAGPEERHTPQSSGFVFWALRRISSSLRREVAWSVRGDDLLKENIASPP